MDGRLVSVSCRVLSSTYFLCVFWACPDLLVSAWYRGHTCSMRYEVNQHGGMLASGDTVFCNFCMYTDGLRTPSVACDGFVVPGTLDCKFDTENKIVSVEMTLDVAAFIRQYEVMSSLCPSMLRHVLTSLDAIQVNTQTPHVVVCKVPLGAALVVYVNEAYWKSIGVDPTSSIAQMVRYIYSLCTYIVACSPFSYLRRKTGVEFL